MAAKVPLMARFFRSFNKWMLRMWHMGMGKWLNMLPRVGGRIMVLTHTGRKSGQVRQTPVNYAEIDGNIFCTAGFGGESDWYRNLMAHPETIVWLPNGKWNGVVEDVSNAPERLVWLREVLISSGFASFAAGINPYRIRDEELVQKTAEYRLMRIHPGKQLQDVEK